MSQPVPPFAVLVAHRVADYEAWKEAFDAHRPARKEASILGHHLSLGADDPHRVYVHCPATNLEKVRVFFSASDLRDLMKEAGVIGAPDVTAMKPVSDNLLPDRLLPGVIVTHRVEDYDGWRRVYDEFDDTRKRLGIVGHAVSQEVSDPNLVIVYHQAEQLDALRRFADSADLQEGMQRAGVAGPPEVHFVQAKDHVQY